MKRQKSIDYCLKIFVLQFVNHFLALLLSKINGRRAELKVTKSNLRSDLRSNLRMNLRLQLPFDILIFLTTRMGGKRYTELGMHKLVKH